MICKLKRYKIIKDFNRWNLNVMIWWKFIKWKDKFQLFSQRKFSNCLRKKKTVNQISQDKMQYLVKIILIYYPGIKKSYEITKNLKRLMLKIMIWKKNVFSEKTNFNFLLKENFPIVGEKKKMLTKYRTTKCDIWLRYSLSINLWLKKVIILSTIWKD